MHLFDIEPRARYGFGNQGMNYNLFGDKYLEVPNEPDALVVNYYVRADEAANGVTATINLAGPAGRISSMAGPARAGLNRVTISLAGTGGRGRGAGAAGAGTSGPLAVGDYTVTVAVGTDAFRSESKPARDRIR
jgi:hypothetical protein